jgi:epidermal growth factor receptor substrate 15
MDTSFPPTQGENALVNQIFNKHDPQKLGIITSEVAIDAFSRAHVHPTILGKIWGIADTDKQGFLTRKGVSIAVRLIGYAQKGEVITGDLANKRERDSPFSKSTPLTPSKAGPLAVFDGFSSSSEPRRAVSPPPTSSRLPPPLSPQDKAKFTRLFNNCGPINGIVSGMYTTDSFLLVLLLLSQSVSQGEKAREVFIKSKLPFEKLSQIWHVAFAFPQTLILTRLPQEFVRYT